MIDLLNHSRITKAVKTLSVERLTRARGCRPKSNNLVAPAP